MLKNKKGLSLVITSLIIVILVLVAIAIIWFVVKNIIESGAGQIDYNTKCLEVDVRVKSVVNTSMTDYKVILSRTGSGDEISGIKLVFFNESDYSSDIIDVEGNIERLATVTKNVSAGIVNANKVEVTSYFKDESGEEKYCLGSAYTFSS